MNTKETKNNEIDKKELFEFLDNAILQLQEFFKGYFIYTVPYHDKIIQVNYHVHDFYNAAFPKKLKFISRVSDFKIEVIKNVIMITFNGYDEIKNEVKNEIS